MSRTRSTRTRCKDECCKAPKSVAPSFSSSFLNANERTNEDIQHKQGRRVASFREVGCKCSGGEDDTASFKRGCLVHKWVMKEKAASERYPATRRPEIDVKDGDSLFFSSTSSSSDSSGALSDSEFFAPPEAKISCFSSFQKPARTVQASNHDGRFRAMKIYENLKKAKQPVSPGWKLTSLINSIFANSNGKKAKSSGSKHPPAPSSASSFSRSCLSMNRDSAKSRETQTVPRTVRFLPIDVKAVLDEESRPCGAHKAVIGKGSVKCAKPPLLPQPELKDIVRVTPADSMSKISNTHEQDDEEDGFSDSSSDLFEIDHLAIKSRFAQQLPLYETTDLDTKVAE